MAKKETTPPHLFVLLAREAPVGVIFRRGPTGWVQLVLWDTAKDTFTVGQWFRGKVYVERCDVSPDGKLLLYHAAKQQPVGNAWTAISKPPYFTSLTFWDWDTLEAGGGLFHDNHMAQLNTPDFFSEAFKFRTEAAKDLFPAAPPLESVWEEHLLRGGWESLQRYSLNAAEDDEAYATITPGLLQRAVGGLMLQLEYVGDVRKTRYRLFDEARGRDVMLPVSWAGVDQRGRLVFTQGGKVFVGSVDADLKLTQTELVAFEYATPDPQPAPEWASRW